jgi:hypothetical protein
MAFPHRPQSNSLAVGQVTATGSVIGRYQLADARDQFFAVLYSVRPRIVAADRTGRG